MKSLHKPNLIISLFTKLTDGGLWCRRPDETDQQMLAKVGKQSVVLLLIITLFDDVLDLVLEILHFVFELMHLLFEVIEGFVEEILEYTLHTTTHHESEIFIISMILIWAISAIQSMAALISLLAKKEQSCLVTIYKASILLLANIAG